MKCQAGMGCEQEGTNFLDTSGVLPGWFCDRCYFTIERFHKHFQKGEQKQDSIVKQIAKPEGKKINPDMEALRQRAQVLLRQRSNR